MMGKDSFKFLAIICLIFLMNGVISCTAIKPAPTKPAEDKAAEKLKQLKQERKTEIGVKRMPTEMEKKAEEEAKIRKEEDSKKLEEERKLVEEKLKVAEEKMKVEEEKARLMAEGEKRIAEERFKLADEKKKVEEEKMKVAEEKKKVEEEKARLKVEGEKRKTAEERTMLMAEEEKRRTEEGRVKPAMEAEIKPQIAKESKGEVITELEDIYFDFDRSDIRPDAKDILLKNTEWLQNNPDKKIQIEGHCDERGTAEYNLALGDRRAMSVKKYLISLGISAERLTTISYGKELPIDPGHNEEVWSKNRRTHFLTITK